MRVDVEPLVANEPDERHPEALGRLDRERGRRAHRLTTGIPARAAFCTISNADPPGDLEHVLGEREVAGEQPSPDDLVDGVVPADVLAEREELARRA